ncbi:MAG: hypothetical protein IJ832_04895 [Bacteroidaceae bacterium]|nr:hypothetical protein [Bacteroidaceae bacterium]
MAKYLDEQGVAHLISKIKSGTLKAGKAGTADVANKVSASAIEGIIPMGNLPKGAVEELYVVASDEVRLGLSKTQVQNGDTVKVTATSKMYFVVDESKLGTADAEDAFEEYIVGTADKVGHKLKFTIGSGSQQTYDGSAEKTMTITPATIGGATSAQGQKADSAVQTIKINDVEQEKGSGGVVNLPPYPTVINKASGILLSENFLVDNGGTVEPEAGDSVEEALENAFALLRNKQDSEVGKGLSANDYTNTEKQKLAGIAEGATANKGTVTSISVGAGLKLASGTQITSSGTIQVDKDSTPTKNSTKLLDSGTIHDFLQNYLPKTKEATKDELGLVKLGDDTKQTVAANSPSEQSGRTYPVQVDAQGHAVVNVPWSNSTYTPASLGQGRGTCATAAGTAAKTVNLSGYSLTPGGVVVVSFSYAVGKSATLNVNGKGAKPIFYRGSAIADNVIAAGDSATFMYDGTNYHLLAIDRAAISTDDIDALINA